MSDGAELEALLGEAPEAALRRAGDPWRERGGASGRPVVLFGAGNLGRSVAAHLRGNGFSIAAFCDNGARLWGTQVAGIPVLSPPDAIAQFGEDALFLVSIWGAGQAHRYADTEASLHARGVRHVAAFGHYAWAHPDGLLPRYALGLPDIPLRHKGEIRAVYARLGDDRSRAELLAQLRWRLHLDYAGLPQPDHASREYFDRDIVTWAGGVFVDGGAYDGDTVARFVEWTGGAFSGVVAVEADPTNIERLRARLASLPADTARRVRIEPCALAGAPGELRFQSMGTGASAVTATGDLVVQGRCLDEVVGEAMSGGDVPAFVKLDIEGAEMDVLTQSAAAIARWRCVVAACCYHTPDHLWRVPAQLLRALPDATLTLRSYGSEAYDLVAYAVPRRIAAATSNNVRRSGTPA